MTPATDADLTPAEEELLRCRGNWLMYRLERLEVDLSAAVVEANELDFGADRVPRSVWEALGRSLSELRDAMEEMKGRSG